MQIFNSFLYYNFLYNLQNLNKKGNISSVHFQFSPVDFDAIPSRCYLAVPQLQKTLL